MSIGWQLYKIVKPIERYIVYNKIILQLGIDRKVKQLLWFLAPCLKAWGFFVGITSIFALFIPPRENKPFYILLDWKKIQISYYTCCCLYWRLPLTFRASMLIFLPMTPGYMLPLPKTWFIKRIFCSFLPITRIGWINRISPFGRCLSVINCSVSAFGRIVCRDCYFFVLVYCTPIFLPANITAGKLAQLLL